MRSIGDLGTSSGQRRRHGGRRWRHWHHAEEAALVQNANSNYIGRLSRGAPVLAARTVDARVQRLANFHQQRVPSECLVQASPMRVSTSGAYRAAAIAGAVEDP